MSTALEPTSTAVASAPTTPTAPTMLRRARGPLIVVALFLLLAALSAIGSTTGVGLLDTRSPAEQGSKAIAEILRDQGVPVRQVRTVAEAAAVPEGTLVVAGADVLTPEAAARVAASPARRIVLAGVTRTEIVAVFAPGTAVARTVDSDVRQPACDLPAATDAGSAEVGGAVFTAGTQSPPTSVAACYPVGGEPSLLVLAAPDRTIVLLGASTVLRNGTLADEGNAALALNLLGADGPVTWYLPSIDDVYAGIDAPTSPFDLIPRGVLWAVGWLAFVVLLLAAWRARRLGPVVSEDLPVVVRAAETVEGRARLYRRGGDRGRAAEILRAATRDRLAPTLGLAVNPARAGLVESAAARADRAPAEVDALLYGAPPPDDAALVRLAHELDRLDREVRRP